MPCSAMQMTPLAVGGLVGAAAVFTVMDQWLLFEEGSVELLLIALALPLGLLLNWNRQAKQGALNAQLKSKFISPPQSPRSQQSDPEPPLKASSRRPGTGGRGNRKTNNIIEQCAQAGDLDGAEQ